LSTEKYELKTTAVHKQYCRTNVLQYSSVNPYIFFWGGGAMEAPKAILYLKMAICGAFLVQFFAVQLKL